MNRIAGQHRAFVARDRLGDGVARRFGAEGRLEALPIIRLRADALDPLPPSISLAVEHFERVLRRPLGLIFERQCPAVPEQEWAVGGVEGGGGAGSSFYAFYAGRTRRLAWVNADPVVYAV